jgi:serine O-acetyltransferase
MSGQTSIETVGFADLCTVSSTVADWHRETPLNVWSPSRQLLASIRAHQQVTGKLGPISALRQRWAVIRHHFWSVVTGAEIHLATRIGGGLLIPHPNGIVIHPDAVIGPNCLIFQQVTIGGGGKKSGVPTLGGHVDVGAGAKILGGVVIGDHAKIGANAVVLDDVPAGATAVGIPARIV